MDKANLIYEKCFFEFIVYLSNIDKMFRYNYIEITNIA
jgi:hypothetical protein